MNHWLVKSEPETWSWEQHVKAKREPWNGVRNHQANTYLKAMAKGDQAFFYHSGKPKEVVGILEVVKPWYPDPKDETGKFGIVDFKAVRPLITPVTLKQIKGEPTLRNLLLVRHTRLSVMPIEEDAWKAICKIGNTEP